MKIGTGLPNQVRGTPPTVIPGWAARTEQAGFSTLGSVGRMAYPGVMDTVAPAAATTSIGLLGNIMSGPAWTPVLLAKETSSIDAISGGRLTLGLGVGIRPDDFVVDGIGLGARGRPAWSRSPTSRLATRWRARPTSGLITAPRAMR